MASGIGLVVGLGNPGERYLRTWHNVGFLAVEEFAKRHSASWGAAEKGKGESARVDLDSGTVRLVKPHTYMNASGEMVGPFARYFKIPPERVLVVSDDFNLPLGRVRIRKKGSSGGQNGLDSILTNFGTQSVPRLRIGIGPVPPRIQAVNFVLKNYGKKDEAAVEEAISTAVDAIADICAVGIAAAMNAYNGKDA